MSLNLHALAVSVIRQAPSPDPDLLIAEFVSQIDPADYHEALVYLSRSLIRTAIHTERSNINGGPRSTGSRKIEAAVEAWKKLLNTPEYISVGWIFLRDATHDQVLEMAGMRRQKSRELASAAKHYDRLAAEMEKVQAKTVADLPDDTLQRLLAPAAKAAKAA